MIDEFLFHEPIISFAEGDCNIDLLKAGFAAYVFFPGVQIVYQRIRGRVSTINITNFFSTRSQLPSKGADSPMVGEQEYASAGGEGQGDEIEGDIQEFPGFKPVKQVVE
jgi:hypothetical protein